MITRPDIYDLLLFGPAFQMLQHACTVASDGGANLTIRTGSQKQFIVAVCKVVLKVV
jgi:hypothetical protein